MAIRSSIDTGRLSAAASRPGIDPRVWLTLAVVKDVAYDADHGMFADVQMLPEGDLFTCLVGGDYAGNDFGEFAKPGIGHIVLVAVPSGDTGFGPIIIKRIFTGSEKPPKEFQNPNGNVPTDATESPTIVIEPGKTARVIVRDGAHVTFEVSGGSDFNIKATGSAQVNIEAEGSVVVKSPDVKLGTAPGSQVARVGDLTGGVLPPLMVVCAAAGVSVPVVPLTGLPNPAPVTVVTSIMSGQPEVQA